MGIINMLDVRNSYHRRWCLEGISFIDRNGRCVREVITGPITQDDIGIAVTVEIGSAAQGAGNVVKADRLCGTNGELDHPR